MSVLQPFKLINITNYMETKKCYKCGEIKDTTNFNKRSDTKDGLKPECKVCQTAYRKYYYKKHSKKEKQRSIDYNKAHRKERLELNQDYYKKFKRRELARIKTYQRKHKKEIAAYRKIYHLKRYKTDPKYHIKKNFSSMVSKRLKRRVSSKKGKSTFSFLPYNAEELMMHLEKQFQQGMTWKNYGEWHVDHKKPDSLFNYTSIEDEEFQKCWALENLQPLWAKENIKKSNKY